ncbi:hypothetical protein AA0498_1322 [Acidomonas methanolica]|nr:hypothetical protein AA0498_1322 [Acidomonas methanolica]
MHERGRVRYSNPEETARRFEMSGGASKQSRNIENPVDRRNLLLPVMPCHGHKRGGGVGKVTYRLAPPGNAGKTPATPGLFFSETIKKKILHPGIGCGSRQVQPIKHVN